MENTVDLNHLIGRELVSVIFDPMHDDTLKITGNGFSCMLTLAGDCCSESWIKSVSRNTTGYGSDHVVTEVVESVIDEDIKDDWCRQDTDIISLIKIVTNNEEIHIEWRNSSNGYYCGWYTVEWSDQ